MPILKRADAEIYYEEYGGGYPVLLFAPGGMRSQMGMWKSPPGGPPRVWNDWTEVLSAAGYRVVAMDQRNAGKSRGAIAADHGWQTYAHDQIALLDHLGIARCHTLGGCIGSSFCLTMSQTAPARVSAQVLQNPIGLNPEFPTYFQEGFADWAKELKASRPELDDGALAAFGRHMWDHDFVYCMGRETVPRIAVPSLVMPGDDKPHPTYAGLALAELLPQAEMLREWKAPAHGDAARTRVLDFLGRHTPKR
ncbi:MAG TPA: alpha/beta fold hydrolase [Stellaceae bacterium]|jgi:pimeloyl-ACP methyl ester carboxylesterase